MCSAWMASFIYGRCQLKGFSWEICYGKCVLRADAISKVRARTVVTVGHVVRRAWRVPQSVAELPAKAARSCSFSSHSATRPSGQNLGKRAREQDGF